MRYVVIATLILLAACSAKVIELSAPMSAVDASDIIYSIEESVTIDAPRAAPTVLRAGTTWRQIGTIEQGNVFDTSDQVVIVNSFNVQEAAIVTNNDRVVGYYLKVSGAFVAVDPTPIKLEPLE